MNTIDITPISEYDQILTNVDQHNNFCEKDVVLHSKSLSCRRLGALSCLQHAGTLRNLMANWMT